MTRGLRALALAACASAACGERAELTALPPEVEYAVVVRRAPDGAEAISPLLTLSAGQLALAVDGDESLEVWGYGAELAPLLADVPAATLARERVRPAAACDSTLPAPRWSTAIAPDRTLSPVSSPRAWTADWLNGLCPNHLADDLHPDLTCAVLSCGRTTRAGCSFTIDVSSCQGGTLEGRLLADGSACFLPGTGAEIGRCAPPAERPAGALGSVTCAQTSGGVCQVDLYHAPQGPPLLLEVVTLADAAPSNFGPSANDTGISRNSLRRMTAVRWADRELMITAWPWGARGACAAAELATPTQWWRLDIDRVRVVATGTTAPCIRELTAVGPTAAVAVTVPAPKTLGLVRLDGDLAVTASIDLTPDAARLGDPIAIATTPRGDAAVLFSGEDLTTANHAVVIYDATTLAIRWESALLRGEATGFVLDGTTAWIGNASSRTIETLVLEDGAFERPYDIPKFILEPLELAGMLLPDPARGRPFLTISTRDVPGLLASSASTRRLSWYGPYMQERAMPTALARYKDQPVATLLSRGPDREFTSHLAYVDPTTSRWQPQTRPLALRVVSDLIIDAADRTWAVAPWDGAVARLPF